MPRIRLGLVVVVLGIGGVLLGQVVAAAPWILRNRSGCGLGEVGDRIRPPLAAQGPD